MAPKMAPPAGKDKIQNTHKLLNCFPLIFLNIILAVSPIIGELRETAFLMLTLVTVFHRDELRVGREKMRVNLQENLGTVLKFIARERGYDEGSETYPSVRKRLKELSR